MTKRVVIMAGGTGGHVFPALAVADELRSRGVEVSWIGTQRGLEAEVIPKAGLEIDWISISALRGKGILGWLSAPFRIMKAVNEAKAVMKKRKPDLVLGMGGFVAGPGGLAAWLTKTPLLIHEQNSVAGMTNRQLSRFAKKVMVAFPNAFSGEKVIDVGNPLRGPIVDVAPPEQRFSERSGDLRVLVIGGSLGAVALNKTVPEAISELDQSIDVWHQTGKRNLEQTQEFYSQANVKGRVVPFIDNMAEAYAWADIVVCRAGALTVGELAAVGVGSILVPFPHAVDDHQTTNAQYLVENGAAVCIQQKDLKADGLASLLKSLMSDKARLIEMAKAARKLGRPRATQQVADICMEYANV